jgi:hypothetical protein
MSELNEAEQAALEIGERISASEDQQVTDTYEKAQDQEKQELVYAGKYRTAQDLEKAYLELQKKLGAPKDEEEAPEEEAEVEEAQEEETEPTEEPTEEAPEEEPTGFTKEEVDAILENIGGEKVYKAACDWAASALSTEEIAELDSVLESNNTAAVKFAVEALVNRYKDQADYQGKQVRGRPNATTGVKPFRSMAEMSDAMNDPRYERDPAYRQDVIDRAAVSNDDIY